MALTLGYERFVRESTDANGNTVLVGADGGKYSLFGPTRMIKASNSWLDDQPYGITSPVQSAGKIVCSFKSSEWTLTGTGSAISDHTGYDAYGVKSGALTAGIGVGPVSITGQPYMLKYVPVDALNEGMYPTTFATPVKTVDLNGKFGLWIYREDRTDVTLIVELSTTSTHTNGLKVTFTGAVFKQGWNFLVFVMRDPQAYVLSSGVSEVHPDGVLAACNGDGSTSNILDNPIAAMRFTLTGTNQAANPIYFDSMWTGFDIKAQYLMGFDASGQSIIDYAIPHMRHKGYITTNFSYYDGTDRVQVDRTLPGSNADTIYAAGWEIVNHGAMHLPGTASPNMAALTDPAEIAYELKSLQAAMLARGWTRGQHFYVSPQSSTSQLCERVIGDLGYPLQRHGVGNNAIQVTPYGIPNPRYCGGFGIGSNTAYRMTTGGVSASMTDSYLIASARAYVDCIIAYGATWLPFSHGIEVAGDDGTGNQTPTDPNLVKQSHFNLLMDYLHAKEDAGLITGLDGSDQLWYGAHAQ